MERIDEIVAKMDALGLWELLLPYNVALKPKGVAFPYFCSMLKGDGKPVRYRVLFLEGWQTMHDYVLTRVDVNYGFYSTPSELPHFELVLPADRPPQCFRHDPGYVPGPVPPARQELVAKLLWEVYGLLLRLESERSLPMSFAGERSIFARVERAPGVWEDTPLAIPDAPPHVEKISFEKADVKKAQDLPLVTADVWELDFSLNLSVITREPRARTVYTLIAVDVATGERVVDCNASVHPELGLRGLWESMPQQVLRQFIRRGKVPGEVRVRSGRVFRFLRALCQELPLKLSMQASLPALPGRVAGQPPREGEQGT